MVIRHSVAPPRALLTILAAIVNVAGIFGPVLAGWMCQQRYLQRRGTMVVGALLTMVFFFAFAALLPLARYY
jgi:sugar phosphate permease